SGKVKNPDENHVVFLLHKGGDEPISYGEKPLHSRLGGEGNFSIEVPAEVLEEGENKIIVSIWVIEENNVRPFAEKTIVIKKSDKSPENKSSGEGKENASGEEDNSSSGNTSATTEGSSDEPGGPSKTVAEGGASGKDGSAGVDEVNTGGSSKEESKKYSEDWLLGVLRKHQDLLNKNLPAIDEVRRTLVSFNNELGKEKGAFKIHDQVKYADESLRKSNTALKKGIKNLKKDVEEMDKDINKGINKLLKEVDLNIKTYDEQGLSNEFRPIRKNLEEFKTYINEVYDKIEKNGELKPATFKKVREIERKLEKEEDVKKKVGELRNLLPKEIDGLKATENDIQLLSKAIENLRKNVVFLKQQTKKRGNA
ncbi:MAG: hypothetical protein ACQEP1_06375, partial [Nanobdellota archaeon]